jgi:hypothetical protein
VVDNIPPVDVRRNGAPATMVLDTGAERTVLTSLNHIRAAPVNSLRESLVTGVGAICNRFQCQG